MTHALFREDAYLTQCETRVVAVDAAGIRLEHTVFYPEGGGQPGDIGQLTLGDGRRVDIVDTRKGGEGFDIVHVPADASVALEAGMPVHAEIDWARRHRLMRMHTCLHLLSAVIVAPVTGGAVGDGAGRLDFDLPESPDKDAVTAALNEFIRSDARVRFRWITDAELAAKPELVKTMSVKPPSGQGKVRLVEIEGIDLQPCGGTHVTSIGEIGRVGVRKIEKKGRQNRRVRLSLLD